MRRLPVLMTIGPAGGLLGVGGGALFVPAPLILDVAFGPARRALVP